MDFIPDKSEIQVENIKVDRDPVLKSLIKDLGVRRLVPGLQRKEQGPRRGQWAFSTISSSRGLTVNFYPLRSEGTFVDWFVHFED